jgi:hypothetical protein
MGSASLGAIAIVIVIFIVVVGVSPIPSTMHWVGTAGLIIAFAAIIGKTVNGRWTGILIDERRVMSLSRFQIIIWTVIIVSAFFTIANARIYAGEADPLAITIDWRLWALLGISSTSLVGTPLILDGKKRKVIAPRKEARSLQDITINDNVQGIVFVNALPGDARFTDIFEGDEVGNQRYVDMSKVQMFFFTIISALGYIVLLFNMLAAPTPPTGLPVLPEGLIALLAISHGAYLTNKAVDHTSTIPIR